MPGRAAEVHEPPFREQDEALAVRKLDVVHLRLDVLPGVVAEGLHVDLGIEVADVGEDRVVLHRAHVLDADDPRVAGRGDEDVPERGRLLHGHHPEALHRGLERADGVDLGHPDDRAEGAKGLRAALADVTVAGDDRDLARHHHVRRPLDPVHQRLATAVEVVELALGHRVVHVEGGHPEGAAGRHLVEPGDAGGGLLGEPAHPGEKVAVPLVHDEGEVPSVVEEHVRPPAAGTEDGPLHAPPVLLLGLPLPREHRNPGRGHRGGGVVLGGEDVAGGPPDLRPELEEGLDEDRGLDGHVQAARDPRSRERARAAVLLAHRHEAGHLVLRDADLLAAPVREGEVRDLVVRAAVVRVVAQFSFSSCRPAPRLPLGASLVARPETAAPVTNSTAGAGEASAGIDGRPRRQRRLRRPGVSTWAGSGTAEGRIRKAAGPPRRRARRPGRSVPR